VPVPCSSSCDSLFRLPGTRDKRKAGQSEVTKMRALDASWYPTDPFSALWGNCSGVQYMYMYMYRSGDRIHGWHDSRSTRVWQTGDLKMVPPRTLISDSEPENKGIREDGELLSRITGYEHDKHRPV